MTLQFLNIDYSAKNRFSITIAYIEYKNYSRSLLHIEKCESIWKFQLLWLSDFCWVV